MEIVRIAKTGNSSTFAKMGNSSNLQKREIVRICKKEIVRICKMGNSSNLQNREIVRICKKRNCSNLQNMKWFEPK